MSETSTDGVASGISNTNPSKSSLLFFTSLVNDVEMKILIDTGATTTFINKTLLEKMKNIEFINKKSSSFLLADGIAKFPITAQVKLRIRFANIDTAIDANVATNLCTDIILGMNYINRYNLSIDIKNQKVSIENKNSLLTMNIDPDERYSSKSVKSVSTTSDFHHVTSTLYTVVPTADLAKQKIHDNSHVTSRESISSLTGLLKNLDKSISDVKYRDALRALLTRFAPVFDTSKHNIANTAIHHVINTVPHSPPAAKPFNQGDKDKVLYNLIQEFLQAELISESHSPYAAPSFLVPKKDGSHRFVVDYRRLNLVTIKDSSPLPNMEDTLRKLGAGYNYFSKLDLKSGFYQIPIRETDKEKTAFITSFGLFQFNVLPMGLKNSPPTFQKVMSDTLKECRQYALVYLDDIIVFSKSLTEHLNHLEHVLTALQAKCLVLNPPKCVFAQQEIDYLGHTITYNKIIPLKDRITAIINIKEPRTLTQANKFIGSLNWYRKFFPKFARIAAPIHAITNLTKANKDKFEWTSAQSEAFHQLKTMLIETPLFLCYPINDAPLILSTDASDIGIGGILQQEVNGEIRNLYYHSQLMTSCERKYSVIEKEALAIYKCFIRMRTFLLGRNIILRTDHCPLCHMMEKTVRNARVDRIACLIQEFNIEKVIHIKGTENCLPDFLSRYFTDTDELFEVDYGLKSQKTEEKINSISTKISSPSSCFQPSNVLNGMVLRSHVKQTRLNPNKEVAHENISDNVSDCDITQDTISSESNSSKFSFNQFDTDKLIQEQENDSSIVDIKNQILNHTQNLSFVYKNQIVYKAIKFSRHSKRKRQVIYLPSSMIQSLLQASHDDPMTGAHFAFDRTYNKLKKLYWWPNMKYHIRSYIASCIICKQFNISRQKPHGCLRPIDPPDGPFQMIGIDFCGPLKRTPRENQYVLIITDHFTRYVTAIPLPTCTAEVAAQALFNEYFCKFGIPTVILSDQGTHFRNQLMDNMKVLIGYNHIYSTPYHPQTNGIVERFNATFISQTSKLQDSQHNNWDEYLQAVVFAYNTGVHKSTKYSPYELLFGRSARLPITAPPQHFSFQKPSSYFEQLRKTLRIFHKATHDNIIIQQQTNKQWYDSNRKDPHYKVGDYVITKIHGNRGKLDPKFSPIPRVITDVDHPIYEIFDEESQQYVRVHVADIRPISFD